MPHILLHNAQDLPINAYDLTEMQENAAVDFVNAES